MVCVAEITACARLDDETITEIQNVLTEYARKIDVIAQEVSEDFVFNSYSRSSIHAYLIERNVNCCEDREIVND